MIVALAATRGNLPNRIIFNAPVFREFVVFVQPQAKMIDCQTVVMPQLNVSQTLRGGPAAPEVK